MPVVFGEMHNHWNQYRECFGFVVLENREEEVVFEEAHRSVGYLEVGTGDGLDQSLEELLDKWLQFGDIADIQNLKQLLEEHGLLAEIRERPVPE